MEELIRGAGRVPMQRTTLYQPASAERHARAWNPPALSEPVTTSVSGRAVTLAG